MTTPVVGLMTAVIAAPVAGRATVAVIDYQWVGWLCEFGVMALLVVVVTARIPLAPIAPDPRFDGGVGVMW